MDLYIFLQTVVLSLIQGLTEFLPISSSAHLLLPSALFGFRDQGIAFDVACHVGTLIAVMVFFKQELIGMFKDCLDYTKTKKVTGNVVMAWYLICGTIPVCIAGYLIDKYLLDSIRDYATYVITATTIIFGIVLYLADRYAVRNENKITENNMGFKTAMIIALSQILAMIPGTSRSGISITASLFCGLTRKAAAKYSFLLSIPLIMAAGLHSGIKVLKQDLAAADYAYMGIGIGLSYISAYLVIKFFMKWIEKIGMTPFVIYRLLLGLVLLLIIIF